MCKPRPENRDGEGGGRCQQSSQQKLVTYQPGGMRAREELGLGTGEWYYYSQRQGMEKEQVRQKDELIWGIGR